MIKAGFILIVVWYVNGNLYWQEDLNHPTAEACLEAAAARRDELAKVGIFAAHVRTRCVKEAAE